MRERSDGHLERLRHAELERVRAHVRPGQRVLEVGGGSGYHAALLASWGCRVQSIDVAGRPRSRDPYYRVLDYDGRRLPFRDACFDLVFSSCVLEHVTELPTVLAEVRRVLKAEGQAIHIVPSTAFRFWTSVAHYGYLVKYLFGWHQIACAEVVPRAEEVVRSRGLTYLISRALVPGPHGEAPTATAELWGFSRRRWRRVFQEAGFQVLHSEATGLFYTGYALCPGIAPGPRRVMARWLGSACHIFLTRAPR